MTYTQNDKIKNSWSSQSMLSSVKNVKRFFGGGEGGVSERARVAFGVKFSAKSTGTPSVIYI